MIFFYDNIILSYKFANFLDKFAQKTINSSNISWGYKMNNILANIVNYINVLNNDYNLQVSFNYTAFPLADILFLQKKNILHANSFCSCIKKRGMKYCLLQKSHLINKCKNQPFFGSCFAGVAEYVFPVILNEKTVNFVSISGYRLASEKLDFEKLSKRCDVPVLKLKQEYEKLNVKIPKLDGISSLIFPLVAMLELYHQQIAIQSEYTKNVSHENELYASIINYLAENYRNNITLYDISLFCHYSQSYICNIFKKFNNKSILQYIIDLKINESINQLIYSNKKISAIAYDLGFSDSNYFTNQFKKRIGISPKEYRNQHKQ